MWIVVERIGMDIVGAMLEHRFNMKAPRIRTTIPMAQNSKFAMLNFSYSLTKRTLFFIKKPHFPISITCSSSSSIPHRSLRCAVLGAGFAGLSVSWHLLQHCPKELHLHIDMYDEVGIGGGASGVSGGLLHPYSPKVKPLWHAAECWKRSLDLLTVAEDAHSCKYLSMDGQTLGQDMSSSMVRRRGILRPATSMKNLDLMNDNAQSSLTSCRVQSICEDAVQKLVPNLRLPLNRAFYMPEAVNIHPQRYLEALFLACENLQNGGADGEASNRDFCLHKKRVDSLQELSGEYDTVIICLGARAAFMSELSGRLPLRTCRGVVAHVQLDDDTREGYPVHGPSILSDAWIAIQGPRSLHLGSTWEWNSTNYTRNVAAEEATKSLDELIPKVSAVYPSINHWSIIGASAGLRGMPPLTPYGSLPLLGCLDDIIGGNGACKYWLFTGLGSRGLLYHGWLGELTAKAVLSCNEELIPSEFRTWKSRINS